jgi:serine/threonine protein kinase
VLLGIWNVKPRRVKFLGCGVFGCSTLWQSNTGEPVVYKRMKVYSSDYMIPSRDPKTQKLDTLQENVIWAFYNPQREYSMLEALNAAGAAVKPVKPPTQTGESREMLLLKSYIRYIPEVGEQYWTFAMQAGQVTLEDFCYCQDFMDSVEGITEQVFDIFKALKANKYTHGDLHLGNIMIMPDLKVKLIDCGYSATNVFEPRYDRAAFTVSCTEMAKRVDTYHTIHKKPPQFINGLKAAIIRLRDDIYTQVKWDASGKQDTYQPMIISITIRNRFFFYVYKQKMIHAQIMQDGPAWCRAVGLQDVPLKPILDQFRADPRVDKAFQSDLEFIGSSTEDGNMVRAKIKSTPNYKPKQYFTDFQNLVKATLFPPRN